MSAIVNNGERIPQVAADHHHADPALAPAIEGVAAEAVAAHPQALVGSASIEGAEELGRESLSFHQVMKLPEHAIESLALQQLEEVDRLLSTQTQQLFELVDQQPGKIADQWALKLYALGCNEHIARKQAHVMVISALVDAIRYHNLYKGWDGILEGWDGIRQGWKEVREHSQQQFAALDAQQARLDKMRQDLQEIRARLEAEPEDALPMPPLDPHEEIDGQYAAPHEPQAPDGIDRNRRDAPQEDERSNYLMVAVVIGCLAIAYAWFRGKGDSPKVG